MICTASWIAYWKINNELTSAWSAWNKTTSERKKNNMCKKIIALLLSLLLFPAAARLVAALDRLRLFRFRSTA